MTITVEKTMINRLNFGRDRVYILIANSDDRPIKSEGVIGVQSIDDVHTACMADLAAQEIVLDS